MTQIVVIGQDNTIEATYAKGNLKGNVTFTENVMITVFISPDAPEDLDTDEVYIHYVFTNDSEQYEKNRTTIINDPQSIDIDIGTTCFWSIGRSLSGSWEEDPPSNPDYCIERRKWPGLNLHFPGIHGPPFWSNQNEVTVKTSVIPNDFDISELDFELFITDSTNDTTRFKITDSTEWNVDTLQHGHTYRMKVRSIMKEDPASKSLYSENTVDLKIDMELPIINISNIPSYVGDELSFNIFIKDNLSGIDTTTITVTDSKSSIETDWSGEAKTRIIVSTLSGKSNIKVISYDKAGNQQTWEGQTYIDQNPPKVIITHECGKDKRMIIRWYASDSEAGLTSRPYSLSIDGVPISNDVSLTSWQSDKPVIENISVEISARDQVGNIGISTFKGSCSAKKDTTTTSQGTGLEPICLIIMIAMLFIGLITFINIMRIK